MSVRARASVRACEPSPECLLSVRASWQGTADQKRQGRGWHGRGGGRSERRLGGGRTSWHAFRRVAEADSFGAVRSSPMHSTRGRFAKWGQRFRRSARNCKRQGGEHTPKRAQGQCQ
jgi:hypothetical protein